MGIAGEMEAIEHINEYFTICCVFSLDRLLDYHQSASTCYMFEHFFSHSSAIQTLSSHPAMSVCTVRTHSLSMLLNTQLSFKAYFVRLVVVVNHCLTSPLGSKGLLCDIVIR